MTPETTTLLPGQVLVVRADPTWPASLVRLTDAPAGNHLLEGRISSYILEAGSVLCFGPYTSPTRWLLSSEQGSASYSFQAPSFAPIAVIDSDLADLYHSTANAGFAFNTSAGWLRWNPVASAWQNVAGAAGAPVSIHAPTLFSRAVSQAFESGATAALDGASTGGAGLFWLNAPTAFSFAWLLDGVAIPAATGAEYVIQAGDVGEQLACTVTATNVSGSATVTTAAVTVV